VVIRAAAGTEVDETGVFAIREGIATFVPVKTGIIGALLIEVAGIEPGTPVVSGPFQVLRTLKDGDRLTVSAR